MKVNMFGCDAPHVSGKRKQCCLQMDFEAKSTGGDAQLQSLSIGTPSQSAMEQAIALRQLEDKARTWAKKFLHKVKAAASQAETRANGGRPLEQITSNPSMPIVRVSREHRTTVVREPAQLHPQYSQVHANHGYDSDGSAPRCEVLQTDWRGSVSDEHIVIEDLFGNSGGLSTPIAEENSKDKKKKKMFFNRLWSGRKS